MSIQKARKGKKDKMGDLEKLLLLFKVVEDLELKISIEDVPLHVFLIDGHGLDFSYIYRFDPEPYSAELANDLASLASLGMIHRSEIKLTQKGNEEVKKN